MPTIPKLTKREVDRLMQLLRESDIKPPPKGTSIRAFEGLILCYRNADYMALDINLKAWEYIVNRKRVE